MTADDRATLLLVDDRPENLLTLEAVLEPLGHEMVRASSGEDALKVLLTHDISTIILDVQMPGLDGFDTAGHIKSRERTRDIPIIFLTALSRESHHAERGYASGAVDYISKPFDPVLLRAKVSVFVQLHQSAQEVKAQRELLAVRLDERYRAEEALAEQAKELERSNAELESFAYVASHDLQEPLRVVGGYLELLAEGELDADATDLVARAAKATDSMSALVRALLAYSRVTASGPEFGSVPLAEVCEAALTNLAEQVADTGADITVKALPTVSGDRAQLTSLFQNLLSNAMKFTEGTTPRVCVEAEPDNGDGAWVVAVHDDGIGIDADDRERVFTMFQRVSSRDRFPGTGIGLATCRRIVERHGGRIWVEPRHGGGTTVRVRLPGAG
jgi:signal transduction histidine kinase